MRCNRPTFVFTARLGLPILISCGLTACAPPAAAPTGASAALAAHQPGRVLGAEVIGRVAPDLPVDLVLGMRLGDRRAVDELLARQSDRRSGSFRKWLSPAEFGDTFGPSVEIYEAVVATVERAGLAVTRRATGRTSLSVRGPAAAVERLLGTELLLWQDGRADERGGRFRAPSAALTMPPALAAVETVVGLDDAMLWRSHRRGPAPGAEPNAGPTQTQEPADLRTRYNVTTAKHPVTNQPLLGAGETIAILGTGFAPADSDVKNFITRYALPTNQAAQYVKVFLGGDNRDPSALANTEYGENVLDIDMVLSMAPLANVIHVITAANGGGLFSDGIAFVVDQTPQAHAVTVSYGSCERVAIWETLQINALLQQAKAEGQAWFFASGDDGTDSCKDGAPTAVPSVNWPSSSPYAFGVGGTQLTSGGVEQAWGYGGGGLSEIFPRPTWQNGVGPYPTVDARQVPDVSALAGDPGVATVFGNTVSASQGTSAAAPMWAGVWALVDESRGGIGMADYHERVYALGKLGGPAFHDVTSGSNSVIGLPPGYPAQAGFDLATGWGTPNVEMLVGGLP